MNDPVNLIDPSGLITQEDWSNATKKGIKGAFLGGLSGATVGACYVGLGAGPGAIAGAALGGALGAGSILLPALLNDLNDSIDQITDSQK